MADGIRCLILRDIPKLAKQAATILPELRDSGLPYLAYCDRSSVHEWTAVEWHRARGPQPRDITRRRLKNAMHVSREDAHRQASVRSSNGDVQEAGTLTRDLHRDQLKQLRIEKSRSMLTRESSTIAVPV